MTSRRQTLHALFGLLGVSACGDTPAEMAPAGSGPVERTLLPLKWTVPPTWPETESSPSGARRAGYKVPRAGSDKEDGELLVLFFGTGANGDRDKQWQPWFDQFDGNAKADAVRKDMNVRGMPVETFEFMGAYKLNMGTPRPGQKKSPVQMVKKDFRMIAAVVKTPDRGNWFFRLVGPDETVLAAREPFFQMLEGVE
ncbi:MAG: hypothetical protein JNK04_23745 [Myxococcales bacterium]|nr:hypothetical protein [Myxococcales bacterium]